MISINNISDRHYKDLAEILIKNEVCIPYFGKAVFFAECMLHVQCDLNGKKTLSDVCLVAENISRKAVGAVSIRCDTLSFFVDPNYWRIGVAGNLIQNAFDEYLKKGAGRVIYAYVYRENVASLSLLEKTGFVFDKLDLGTPKKFHERAQLRYNKINV